MRKIFVVSLLILLFNSCHKKKYKILPVADSTPFPVKEQIYIFNEREICKEISVDEFLFQNEKVYVFEVNCCCDQTSGVIDSKGKSIGYLGGFVGNMNIRGESFSSALFIRTVWKR